MARRPLRVRTAPRRSLVNPESRPPSTTRQSYAALSVGMMVYLADKHKKFIDVLVVQVAREVAEQRAY